MRFINDWQDGKWNWGHRKIYMMWLLMKTLSSRKLKVFNWSKNWKGTYFLIHCKFFMLEVASEDMTKRATSVIWNVC